MSKKDWGAVRRYWLQNRCKYKHTAAILAVILVVVTTVAALRLSGHAQTGELNCDLEHEHTAECYTSSDLNLELQDASVQALPALETGDVSQATSESTDGESDAIVASVDDLAPMSDPDPAPAPESNSNLTPAPDSAPTSDVPQILTVNLPDYTISVDLAGKAQEGYSLLVNPLATNNEQLAAVEKELTEELPNGITKQAHVDAKDVVLFDISVRNKDNNEVELDDTVRVSVVPTEAQSIEKKDEVPEVVHLEKDDQSNQIEAEHLATKPEEEGFTFETEGFSPFAFVYTVDFEYQGYAWSMPGGSTVRLSTVLAQLQANINIADVTAAAFSNPELVEVTPAEDESDHDWMLTSLAPFTTSETLTLTLANGDTVVIRVTDDGEGNEGNSNGGEGTSTNSTDIDPNNTTDPRNIRGFLNKVEFFDNDNLIGDSSSPDTMVVRPGHEYTMRLNFSENESGIQFPDDGIMYYRIPDGVILSTKAFDENSQFTFDIVLDRKHTLTGNTVTYIPPDGTTPGYIEVQWNTAQTVNYKLLKASPRTVFMLSFPFTTLDPGDGGTIAFSDKIVMNVQKDPTYDVALEKTVTPQEGNAEIMNYEVVATADGNVTNVTFTDTMGAALTYRGTTAPVVHYFATTGQDEDGNPIYGSADDQYTAENIKDFAVADDKHGFSFKLETLKSGHKATISYSADVDYTKLGGKNNIQITSRNTVVAKDSGGEEIAETHQSLETAIDYLQIGKRRLRVEYEYDSSTTVPDNPDSEFIANNWKYMYVEWQVIYNPDRQINVEGASIKDEIWKGRKYATTYVTDNPDKGFTVKAYTGGTYQKDDGSTGDTFTSEGAGTSIITPSADNGNGWGVEGNSVTVTQCNQTTGQLSSWEWKIPEKAAHELNDKTHYTYVIEYWTRVERTGEGTGGYVGNQATESIADITRDKSVNLPGIGTDDPIEVHKEHVIDDYASDGKVYTQWKITFDRRASRLERALVEDTLPHQMINGHVCTDVIVNKPISEDSKHGWEVKGLYAENGKNETCVPKASLDGYNVVFWFYTQYNASYTNPNDPNDHEDPNNVEGLYAASADDSHKTITITFWTENDNEWIEATANGKATPEHWNHIHLVLDGKEAVDKTYAVPKPRSELKKRMEEVGSWTDGNIILPVYRYTLTLNGVNDDTFTTDDDGNKVLTVTDEFSGILDYLPVNILPEATDSSNKTVTLPGDPTGAGATSITLKNRSASDGELVRTLPTCEDSWDAVISDPVEVDVTGSEGENTTDKNKQITVTVTVTPEQQQQMQYQVTTEDGKPLTKDGVAVMVYGKSYEVSYYLAPDFDKVKQKAQDVVDKDEYQNTKIQFKNTATWDKGLEAGASTFEANFDYDLSPVKKKLASYDEESELATYSIVINPLKLKMNSGQRYSVEDTYRNMAVDFQTVRFTTDPVEAKDEIEWSYHSNKGTFWVPDETKVTITYEGWPVGRRGNSSMTFSNEASIGDFQAGESKTIKLEPDHSGSASTYRVRIFKFADDNMDEPLADSVFQLFENDENGNIVPMTYGANSGVSDGNNAYDHWDSDDDYAWRDITEDRARAAGILNSHGFIPTPERHYAGDYIYFVTGKDGDHSEQAGFAEVMLSQSRDGVSLKKNKQYYLREVLTPEGYLKESVDWRFIIGDNDDFDNYVYSDDSILQVSNATADRVLTVRKTVIDRTSGKWVDYDTYQKNIQFEIVGKSLTDPNEVIYNKTVPYSAFMAVDTPRADDPTKTDRDYLLIIKSLQPGTYTVREVRSSAEVSKTVGEVETKAGLTTSVEATATCVDENDSQSVPENALVGTPISGGAEERDSSFTFTVREGGTIKTTAEATFTNIYTDENPITLTVGKDWHDKTRVTGDNTVFTPKKTEFALYADDEKYDLSSLTSYDFDAPEGVNWSVNDQGNLVLEAGANKDQGWQSQVTIKNLPHTKVVNNVESAIVWNIQEVSATYSLGGADVTVTDELLSEHFTMTASGDGVGTYGSTERHTFSSAENNKQVQFTNTFNSLTTVNVHKTWNDSVDHNNDVVYFDLYRTTTQITDVTDLRNLVSTESLTPVIKNIELAYDAQDSSKSWTYTNDLLEKLSAEDNRLYYYFALERSVAGYQDSYTRTSSTEGQTLTITNTPIANDPKGKLVISKSIAGVPTSLNKQYSFTLWNSGKYLKENGELTSDEYVFTVPANGSLEFNNVKLGTYVLTEVEDSTKINGYKLSSVTATVDESSATVTDLQTEVTVPLKEESTTEGKNLSVAVTNTYERNDPKMEFSFGKLWVMPVADENNPNEGDTTTLVWPKNTTITMKVQRRVKGSTEAESGFEYMYTIKKENNNNITVTHDESVPELEFSNPDMLEVKNDGVTSYTYNDGSYHHYTFTLKGLDKYNENGEEWEYFAQEMTVTDANGNNLLDPANTTGHMFVKGYGYVDGIGSHTVSTWNDAAGTSNGVVRYAINRLKLTKQIEVQVQKSINGRLDWGKGENGSFPAFTFKLYDAFGREVKNGDNQPVTATSNTSGQASFVVTNIVDLNEMVWRSNDLKLTGAYTFSVRELNDAQNPLDATDNRHGITYNTTASKFNLNVTYDWLEGTLTSSAIVTNPGPQPEGTAGKVVINNTYDPDKATLVVKKQWDDTGNQDGYRVPAKFKVTATYYQDAEHPAEPIDEVWTVKADGSKDQVFYLNNPPVGETEYRIEVGTENNDSTTVTLPKYYEGHLITYSVTEIPPESVITEANENAGAADVTLADKYTQSQLGNNVLGSKNHHDPETINVSAKKLWDHTGNANANKPNTIEVRLVATYENGDGTQVVKKETLDNYQSWKTSYEEAFAEVTLSGDAVHTWQSLPRFAPGEQGRLVSYTIEEVPESIPLGYRQVTSGDSEIKETKTAEPNQTAANVLKNKYESVTIPLRKVWSDDEDRDGLRNVTTSVTMRLSAKVGNITLNVGDLYYQSGTKVDEDLTVTGTSASTTWDGNGWVGLPKYYHGQEITYTVTEQTASVLDDYDASDSGVAMPVSGDSAGTRSVTNAHDVDRTTATLTKTWDDANDQDGKRPDVTTFVRDFVHLYAQVGTDTATKKELVIGNTPITEGGNEYYLYEKTGDVVASNPYTIQDKKPIAMLVEGTGANTNTYTVTYTQLPKYENHGVLIDYSVTEIPPQEGPNSGYVIKTPMSETSGENSSDFTIENRHISEAITVNAQKTWNDSNTTARRAPVTLHIKATYTVGTTEHVVTLAKINDREAPLAWATYANEFADVTLDLQNSWNATSAWTGLPRYAPGEKGVPVHYSVVEDEATMPLGYRWDSTTREPASQASDGTEPDTITFTVTNAGEWTNIPLKKVWSDANNQDGLRPQSVTMSLAASTADVSSITFDNSFINASGNPIPQTMEVTGSATTNEWTSDGWVGLPAYYRGKPITYTVTETAVSNYSQSNNGTVTPVEGDANGTRSITNSHTPEIRTVTFTKQWDQKGIAAADHPDVAQLASHLHLWRRVKGTTSDPVEVANASFSVSEEASTHTCTITVAGLPKYLPKDSPSAGSSELEYFVTEDDAAFAEYTPDYGTGNSRTREGGSFTNTRDTGTLTITKNVISDLAADANQEFTFGIQASPAINKTYTGTIHTTGSTATTSQDLVFNEAGELTSTLKLKGGQYITIDDLPVGETFTVTENHDRDVKFSTESSPTNGAVELTTANRSGTVTFTNTRATGGLQISKTTVSDAAADANRMFTFTVTLTGLSDAGKNATYVGSVNSQSRNIQFTNGVGTVTLKNGETQTITGLPVDAEYSVVETADSGFTTTTPTNASGTITAGTASLSFENTRKTSALVITKVLASDRAADANQVFTFHVDLNDTTINKTYSGVAFTAGVGTFTLKGGENKRIEGLPRGVTYTVTEDHVDGYTTTSEGSTGTISDTTPPAVFTNTRITGDLTISKSVVSDAAVDASQEFTFTVSIPGLKAAVKDKTYAGDNGSRYTNVQFNENGIATFTLKGGEHQTITDLPTDVTYTVTETANSDFVTAKTGDTGTITVTTHENADNTTTTNRVSTAAFTNTRKTGDLTVTKTVSSQKTGDTSVPFSFLVELSDTTINGTYGEMNFNGGKATFTLSHEGSVTATGLPTGVDYTVTETPDGGFTTTSEDASGTIVEDADSQTAGNQPKTAAFTNTRKTGKFTIKKTVESAAAADHAKSYLFKVELDDTGINGTYGNVTFINGVADNVAVVEGTPIEASGLPTDIRYTVTEYIPENFRLVGSAHTSEVISATTDWEATFTNVRDLGGLIVTKELESDLPSDNDQEFEFTVTLDDTGINGTYGLTQYDHGNMTFVNGVATFKLKNGEYKATTGLPRDVGYTVTEKDATGFTIDSKEGCTGVIKAVTLSDTGEVLGNENVHAAHAVFKNRRVTGGLEISKSINSERAADSDYVFTFTVELSEPINGIVDDMTFHDGKATVQLKGGESAKALTLPAGVTYTVTEGEALGFQLTAEDQETGTIPDKGAVAHASFTNTRMIGSLEVSKVLVSDLAVDVDQEYEFTITLDGLTDEAKNKTYDNVEFKDGVATVTLKGGESQVIGGLPTDIDYTVEETAVEDFATTSENEKDTVSTELSKAIFTNTRHTGNLTVSKKVESGVTTDHDRDFTFNVELKGLTEEAMNGTYKEIEFEDGEIIMVDDVQFKDGKTTFTLKSGEDMTIGGLPVGTTYTVTEEPNDLFVTTIEGDAGTIAITTNTDEEGKEVTTSTSTAIFTNTRKSGNLQLTKIVDSPFDAEKDARYTFKVTMLMPDEDDGKAGAFAATGLSEESDGMVTFDDEGIAYVDVQGRKDKPVLIYGLPAGAEYAVTEVAHDAIFDQGEPVYMTIASDGTKTEDVGDTHTIVEDTTHGVEVTNTRKTLRIAIHNVSAANPNLMLEGAEFELSIPDGEPEPVGWTGKRKLMARGGYLVEEDANGNENELFVLAPGTYQLVQTKGPKGNYLRLVYPATFTVTPDGVVYADSILENNGSVEVEDDDEFVNRVVHIKVANSTGTELPATGGFSDAQFYLAGCVLLALAGMATIRLRRARP